MDGRQEEGQGEEAEEGDESCGYGQEEGEVGMWKTDSHKIIMKHFCCDGYGYSEKEARGSFEKELEKLRGKNTFCTGEIHR